MKQANIEKELAATVMDAVRDLLGCLPAAEVAPLAAIPRTNHHPQVDGLIQVFYGGVTRLLAIEVKAHGAPRYVRSAVYHLESCVARIRQSPAQRAEQVVPMLVCPYLSPESRAICRDYDIAYLDLEGNARLVFDGVYIDRSVSSRPKPETRALRSIFTPKAAAILRALLREPDRSWLVTDLAASAHASLGHVSNVCRALLEREWVDRRDDGIVLTQPDALIQTWREKYHRPRGERFDAYTHVHGRQFDDLVRSALNAQPGSPRAIYALASAAQWLAPFSRDPTRSFYSDEAGAQVLRDALDVRPVGTGPNVVVHVITDDSIFDDADEPLPGLFSTSPIVTYLDLWSGNDREREAADHLAKKALPWIP